ncbi:MAG: class I SAM-dependent methyltransferase [Dermatophilaceae bacterium]
MTPEPSLWDRKLAENPDHSRWYVQRFRDLAAAGKDLVGEARLIDAMAPRGARILDAGCGPGRHGGWLHRQGHTVVGVDGDATLIDAAIEDHPGPTWLVGNLAELDLPSRGIAEPFDLVLCAGNVVTFLAPSTRRESLRRMGAHLAQGGRLVVGFGTDREYAVADFAADLAAAGLTVHSRHSTWELHPYGEGDGFLVAILGRSA